MTPQETSEWIGRPLTANETRFHRVLVPFYRAAQDEKILSAKAWVEVPIERLQEPIPQVALNQFFGTTENEDGVTMPNVTDMVLANFTFSVEPSLDGTKAIIRAGAKHGVTYRKDRVTADDLADWMGYLNAFGFTDDDLLTMEERAALQQSEAYSTRDDI